jgi:hypothetical protein
VSFLPEPGFVDRTLVIALGVIVRIDSDAGSRDSIGGRGARGYEHGWKAGQTRGDGIQFRNGLEKVDRGPGGD